MAERLARTAAALAVTAALSLASPAAGLEQDPSPAADPHAGHDMAEMDGGTAPGHDQAPDDHDHAETTDDSGHDGHGQLPATVTPEVRNLVLSGFAGVNAAVIFGAWLMRRTGPDPDPRRRAPKATS